MSAAGGQVRWGFLGAGHLVHKATAGAVHAADGAVLYATAARDLDRARATEPTIAYDSYAALVADPAVDAVYICLANDAHLPWILASIEAGKHVLCEKPLVLSADAAAAAFAAAERAGVHLVEAVWSRWHPRMRRAIDLAVTGELGPLDEYLATFTFDRVAPDNYRLQPSQGGGALYDVGIYPLHALFAMLPDVQVLTVADVQVESSDTGVDLTTQATVGWGEGTRGSIGASFVLPPSQRFVVGGSQGRLRMDDDEAFTRRNQRSELWINDRAETFPAVDPYRIMFEQMSARIRGEDGWLLPARDSIRVAGAVDMLQRAMA
jgi:xylose dehydrogenase (NAD/NADP)